jgi:antitoxin VapB
VRIPKELGFAAAAQEVEIERKGDVLMIRPVRRRSLAGLLDKFAAFPKDFMAEGRESHKERERAGW